MDVIGHARNIAYIKKVLEKGTLSHGYLFHGPEGVGKRYIAELLAKGVLCSKKKTLGGCGACPRCEAFLRGILPSYIVLHPGEPILASLEKGKREMGIDEVREVRRRLALSGGGWQVVLVDQAESLTEEGANAFLKMLEEPRGKSLFLFISRAPEYVLPTIASRLVSLPFSYVPDTELKKMKGATDELVALAAGAPGMLNRLAEDPALRKKEELLYKEAERIYRGGLSVAVCIAEEYAALREERRRLTLYLLSLARAGMLADAQEDRRARRMGKALQALEVLDTTNVNQRLALDIIFMNLRSL